jgi:glycosyltransferase involved in cell wall biosynthesis
VSLPVKLTVTSTFGIHPPLGGGQLRILHLCRRLAASFPVDVIALVAGDEAAVVRQLAPGLREIRVPKTPEHVDAETELERDAGVPVTDVAFPELHALTPKFAEAVAASAVGHGVLMASHPYTLPVLEGLGRDLPILYDVQDVAGDLKAMMLAPNAVGSRLLEATRAVERACCDRAALILATSAEDTARLRELYGVPQDRLTVVPNGVDVVAVPFTGAATRRELRARLGMERPLALFVGSWHQPNLSAVRRIIELAHKLPQISFAVVGSVCLPFEDVDVPANLDLMGIVDDELKATLLAVASVALNPMSEGSGTNIKMLDYLAAGVPVVSTTVGARGLLLDPERHLRTAVPGEFAAAIRAVLDEPLSEAEARALAGRAHVEQHFDWDPVARHLLAELERLPGAAQSASASRATTA